MLLDVLPHPLHLFTKQRRLEYGNLSDQRFDDILDKLEPICPLVVVPWVVLVHPSAEAELLLYKVLQEDETKLDLILVWLHLSFVIDDLPVLVLRLSVLLRSWAGDDCSST